jgi:hypothetical protein
MEELSSLQSKQFQYHNSDNNNIIANINLIVDVLSTNTEEEIKKLLNYYVVAILKNLVNKDMEGMVISNNSSKNIMKDYLEVALDIYKN